MRVFVGIDTGINGACVALNEYGCIVGCRDLPHYKEIPCYRKEKPRSVLDINKLKLWLNSLGDIHRIAVEESPSFNQGVVSAATTAFNSGMLHATCLNLVGKEKFQTVAPKMWQNYLFDEATQDTGWSKEKSIAFAKREHGEIAIFEKPKRTCDGFADASHIAMWCLEQYKHNYSV